MLNLFYLQFLISFEHTKQIADCERVQWFSLGTYSDWQITKSWTTVGLEQQG